MKRPLLFYCTLFFCAFIELFRGRPHHRQWRGRPGERSGRTNYTYPIFCTFSAYIRPPGGGVITSEFNDFVGGNNASRMADRNPKTVMELPHTAFCITWAGAKQSFVNQYRITAVEAPAMGILLPGFYMGRTIGRSGKFWMSRRTGNSRPKERPWCSPF